MSMATSSPLLDMLAVSQRAASWRFDLCDQQLRVIGELEVDRTSPPTLSTDTSRAIKRTLTGVRLNPGVIDDVDVIRDRVKLTMVLHDATEWPQGFFLFSDVSRAVVSAGIEVALMSLVDQGLIVDQQTDHTISLGPGVVITDALTLLLAELPIEYDLTAAGAVITPEAEAVSWAAGTSRLRIINELASMIGYHDLYFDNLGVGQLHLMPNPELTDEELVMQYPSGGRTYRGSTTRSTDLLELPNRFVVLNNGATNASVYAKYDLPTDAPHSIANRGFVITHVEELQGIATNAQALQSAQSLARLWRFPYETVEFASPPDPRHDHYDTVNYEGDMFLELSWSMPLADGSEMRHVIRRTYESDPGAESFEAES